MTKTIPPIKLPALKPPLLPVFIRSVVEFSCLLSVGLVAVSLFVLAVVALTFTCDELFKSLSVFRIVVISISGFVVLFCFS